MSKNVTFERCQRYHAGSMRAVWLPTMTLYTCLQSPQIRTRCAMWGEVESCMLSGVRRNEVSVPSPGGKSWASGDRSQPYVIVPALPTRCSHAATRTRGAWIPARTRHRQRCSLIYNPLSLTTQQIHNLKWRPTSHPTKTPPRRSVRSPRSHPHAPRSTAHATSPPSPHLQRAPTNSTTTSARATNPRTPSARHGTRLRHRSRSGSALRGKMSTCSRRAWGSEWIMRRVWRTCCCRRREACCCWSWSIRATM